jgi:single-strand DNA-binding protein
MQMNRIEIAGYTAADPEMRYLPSGTRVVNLRLGESHRYTGSDNQAITQTNWHNLTFYNALAEQAMGYKKGINLFVEGSVQQRKFTPKDGSERTVHEVVVQSCHVIENSSVLSKVNPNEGPKSSVEEFENDESGDTWPL